MNPNIVLIVADCLRQDRVGRYKYGRKMTPTLDKLAADGREFKNTYSTGSWTVPAHGSLFTGMYPTEHGAHAQSKSLSISPDETLAGVLSSQSYNSVGFSTNPWVTPEFGFDEGFEEFYSIEPSIPFAKAGHPREIFKNENFNSSSQKWMAISEWILSGNTWKRTANVLHQKFSDPHPIPKAETVRSDITQWLMDQPSDSPFFMFVNFMDVHEPYQMHDNYLDREMESVPNVKWNLNSLNQPSLEETTKQDLVKVYDASVQYLDYQLESLISQLKESSEIDDTIIIIMSDHGQSLGEHSYWGHGTFLHDELINIPLVVSAPEKYLNCWPDPSMTISVGEIPYYILNSIDKEFTQNMPLLKKSAEKKLQGEDSPVLAESHGLHEEGDYPDQNVSRKGYRAVYLKEWRLLRDLSKGSSNLNPVTDEAKRPIPRSRLEEFEAELSRMESAELGGEIDIESETKQRLEDLGYM